MSSSSSTSSSDSEDDERDKREDLIRRKLMESFYGANNPASNTTSAVGGGGGDDDDDDDDDGDDIVQQKMRQQQQSMKSSNSTATSMELDSPNFDAFGYAQHSFKNKSIEQLLAIDNKLVSSVKRLDSTMQTLVYENYSKFIDATDAIRSIGKSVDQAESAMSDLVQNIEVVAVGAKQVDDSLRESREVVKEKLRVKNHLMRLDALLKLPAIIKGHVDNRRYQEAAAAYVASRDVLKEHSGTFSSLSKIKFECDEIISNLRSALEEELNVLDIEEEGRVGQVEEEKKSTRYVFGVAHALTIMNEDVMHKKKSVELASSILKGLMGFDDEFSFLVRIARAAKQFSGAFESGPRDHDAELGAFVSDNFSRFMVVIVEVLEKKCEDFEGGNEGGGLKSLVVMMVERVKQFSLRLNSAPINLPSTLTNRFVDKAYEVVTGVVNHRIASVYKKLRQDCVVKLCDFVADYGMGEVGEIGDKIAVLCSTLVKKHQLMLDTFLGPMVTAPVDSAMVNLSIHAQARTFALWLAGAFELSADCSMPANICVTADSIIEVVGINRDDDNVYKDDLHAQTTKNMDMAMEDDPFEIDTSELSSAAKAARGKNYSTLALAFAEAARGAEKCIIKKISDALSKLVDNHFPADFDTGAGLVDVNREGLVGMRFRHTEGRCLRVFAGDIGVRAGRALCVGLHGGGGWVGSTKEVRAPRECLELFFDIVRRASVDCGNLWGTNAYSSEVSVVLANAGGEIGRRSTTGGMSGGLLDKLFSEQISIVTAFEGGSRENVVLAILKMSLRAFLLKSRNVIFSKNGAEQILLDLDLLHLVLPHYHQLDSVLEGLLGELNSVAAERCVDRDVFLQSAVASVCLGEWIKNNRTNEKIFVK